LEARQARKQARKQKRKQEREKIVSTTSASSAPTTQKRKFDKQNDQAALLDNGAAVKFSKLDFGDQKKRQKLDPKLALKKLQDEKSKVNQLDSEQVLYRLQLR
jgi:hypothetical protein